MRGAKRKSAFDAAIERLTREAVEQSLAAIAAAFEARYGAQS